MACRFFSLAHSFMFTLSEARIPIGCEATSVNKTMLKDVLKKMVKPVFVADVIQQWLVCMCVESFAHCTSDDYGTFEFKFELKLELHNIFLHRDHEFNNFKFKTVSNILLALMLCVGVHRGQCTMSLQ